MATTFSPAAVAREASTKDRKVTDKAVRGLARSIIARFDKVKHPGYQHHAYTAAERSVLLAALKVRANGGKPAPKVRRATRARKATPDATA